MEKEYLLQITNELYRLTLLFPKKEPLRYKMRELADEILASLLISDNPLGPDLISTISKLEVLDGFFEVARAQNWLKSAQLLVLQQEYQKLKNELKGNLSLPFKPKIEKKENEVIKRVEGPTIGVGVGLRQKKILDLLKEKGRVQVWQIKEVLPEVSKRTLRRDFDSLLKRGLVERVGERNNTFYRLKMREA